MKEAEFKHYYHLYEIDRSPRWARQLLYLAYPLDHTEFLKQNPKYDVYTSDLVRLCAYKGNMSSQLQSFLYPIGFTYCINVPIAITDPQCRWNNGNYYYSCAFTEPGKSIIDAIPEHEKRYKIYFSQYQNNDVLNLHFTYEKCCEYCNKINGDWTKPGDRRLQILKWYLKEVESNLLVAKLAFELFNDRARI